MSCLSRNLGAANLADLNQNPQSILADLASMLLSNLTASSAACSAILSLNVSIILDITFPNAYYPTQSRCGTCPAPVPYPSGESREVLALPLLLDAFVQGAQVGDTHEVSKRLRKGDLHFLASVFANLTVVSRAINISSLVSRLIECSLQRVVTFSWHLVRLISCNQKVLNILWRNWYPSRNTKTPYEGAALLPQSSRHIQIPATTTGLINLRNCAFHVPGHRAMLSPDTIEVGVPPSTSEAAGINILPHLLLPLAGPEEFDLEVRPNRPLS